MSIKKYFEVAESIQSLASKTSNDISGEIESSGYHEQDIIEEERFIPYTDFSKPENFARYGSAEEYYDSSLKRIYGTYPYDGSLKERLEWQNDSTYLDLYILQEKYPRTNGYVILSADGWGATGALTDGYAIPADASDYEYIFFIGGPNPSDTNAGTLAGQFTGSNYYEPSMNRASNLQMDIASRGASVEFWLKKDDDFPGVSSTREVIFDLWNGELTSSADYGRLTVELDSTASPSSPFRVTLQSGSDDSVGFFRQDPAASTLTYAEVTDNSWHHYAFTFASASAGVLTRFYVDGNLNNETTLGTAGVNDIDATGLQAYLGALITAPSGSTAGAYYGKLSGSVDEFRYWKTQRTSKDIGRYWFTQVGGGVNTDPLPYIETQEMANVNLGVYFKFNEGITGVESTDSTVLDYSGRYSNGTWTGYTSKSRNTGSAIVLSTAATAEFKDPIIYSFHPEVVALAASLELSGSAHDASNNAAVYNSIPAWITEEDTEGSGDVRQLTQILSSYFDTLQLQVENINTLKDIRYMSGSFAKPLPFAEKLLSSTGMVAPNLFLDADLLEKLADRSEKRLYDKSLHDIKNTIYQNIYNNISFIYKSKGTEKAFRNLIRCFGVDDELIKTNMYANNVEYELRNNRRNVIVTDRFINFNTADNMVATVFNYADVSNPNSVSYITSSAALTGGYATTLEAEILFPLKPEQAAHAYFNTSMISASLFGVHGAEAALSTDTTWTTEDGNFQVYAIRDEKYSDNVRFLLTGSSGGYVPRLETALYENVYNNTRWNLSVRIRPSEFPLKGLVDGASSNYIVELHGVQAQAGEIMEQFTLSGSITAPPDAFMTSAKRVYIGAHRENFTGAVLQRSDVKVNACRYWLDYLSDEALTGHILDTENHGALQSHLYAFEFNTSASFGNAKKIDTLVFNWEFLNNTGSAATGFLTVDDISSGSANTETFGELSGILSRQHTAQGRFFAASSTTAIDKDYVVSSKLNLPENVQSQDMIRVLNAQEQDVFTTESRPTNYYFAFEKSMYQVISEEMINYFANMKDFNNLIGDQVERYRPDYKQLSFMRQKFFEQVENDQLDFDKFYEFYKWFDSSLSLMLGQLVPASADFSENVRTVIESHVLERPKYQQKFPFLQRKGGGDITGSVDGNMAADSSAQSSPEEYAQGTGMISNTAFTKRQIGSSNTSQVQPWKMFHAPLQDTEDGGIAKSILFDGVDEYLQSSTHTVWEGLIGGAAGAAKAFSVSMWVRPKTAFVNGRSLWAVGAPTANGRKIRYYATAGRIAADCGTNFNTLTTGPALSLDTWQHLVVTFGGGETIPPKIYVDTSLPAAGDSTAGSPGTITTYGMGIGAVVGSAGIEGYMCDVAVWDKELSSVEVTEIYGSGKRVYLSGVSCASSLLSWWRMGSDPLDDKDTIYDQVGGRNATGNNLETADITAESPSFVDPYLISNDGANKNIYWHRYMEEQEDSIRTDLLKAIRSSFDRRVNSPIKFSTEGYKPVVGVARHPNNRPNYVFAATAPCGPTVPDTNIPTNIMLSFDTDVEQLLENPAVYYPTYKQRLGFGMDPSINIDGSRKTDGNTIAPFSLYSSSVTTGYNAQVVTQYKSGTMVTNLHSDFVDDHAVPMQGPFTEKYVGGRYYRHTALNTGTDTRESRAEGFRLELGVLPSVTALGSLGVVPPNFPFADSPLGSAPHGYLPDLPTAQRFREETAKRPVNIRNIQMRTGSTIIGNYEKNYQVINTAGRTINDPFFQDQSFDFALNPQSPYPRLPTVDRHPAQNIRVRNTTAISIDTTSNTFRFDADAVPAMNTNKQETWSFWLNCTNPGSVQFFIVGDNSDDRVMGLTAANKLIFQAYFTGDNGQWTTDLAVTTGNEWIHVAVVYDGSSDANDPQMFVNGAEVALDPVATIRPTNTLNDYTGWISLGQANLTRFTGYISDIAFYNKTLTNKEIAAVYGNSTLDLKNYGPPRVESNLLLWYRCGNGPGDSTSAIIDQMGNTNLVAVNSPSLIDISPGDCLVTANDNNFALPDRSGANSNQTIIVNRFSSPGEYSTLSRGYMEPAHEELAVNNASPYRNRRVIDYGMSGSASLDPSIQNTIRVVDQIDKNRGLNQLSTLHAGPFGIDSAYGEVLTDTYSTVPSWQKTNRNRRRQMKNNSSLSPGVMPPASNYTASTYDNLYVQHAIPRSEQQYSWITASLASGQSILGLDAPSCFSASTLSQLVTSSDQVAAARGSAIRYFGGWNRTTAPLISWNTKFTPVAFNGLSDIVLDPVSASTHIQGFPSMTSDPFGGGKYRVNYINSDFIHFSPGAGSSYGVFESPPDSPGRAAVLNAILLNRNGPYGYPTWKQIRAGESPVARKLRETNQIGTVIPPSRIADTVAGQQINFVRPTQPNTFVDYFESPIESSMNPVYFYFEDNTENSDTDNNLVLTVPYGNRLEYFSNEGLNNRLGLQIDLDTPRPYDSVVEFALASSLSMKVDYSERIYPSQENAYKPEIRSRTNFTITNIWDDSREKRSLTYGGQAGSMGQVVASASIWPLDGHLNFTTTSSVTSSDGSGELMNSYSRFSSSLLPPALAEGSDQIAAPTYASRVIMGKTVDGANVVAGDTKWLAAEQSGKNPYQNYNSYSELMHGAAKDYSIVPEFRVSSLMATYIQDNGANFLADLNNVFSLTGAVINDSSQDEFYKTYSNADFLKYFKYVDEDLDAKRSGNLKLVRDKISLNCDAFIKFLPYKGFYPVERTLELATLFSQSFGKDLSMYGPQTDSAYRIINEPLFAPGVLYNTIKAGVACGNIILGTTSSVLYQRSPAATPLFPSASCGGTATPLPEGDILFPAVVSLGETTDASLGVVPLKVPFEAIYKPRSFFNYDNLKTNTIDLYSGGGPSFEVVRIYDTGVYGTQEFLSPISGFNRLSYLIFEPSGSGELKGGELYESAMDNFLCETLNIFTTTTGSTFQSAREDDFLPVVAGTPYRMAFKLSTALSTFDPYTRVSAFGFPLDGVVRPSALNASASFSHLTPSYFAGYSVVNFEYTPLVSGRPLLDDILSNLTMSYSRKEYVPNRNAKAAAQAGNPLYDPRMQIDSSFNLTEKIESVPAGTNELKSRWVIQSKFETPLLNFKDVEYSAAPASVGSTNAADLITRGLWHQYGSIPTGSSVGVFAAVESPASASLADIVGFNGAVQKRLGAVKKEFLLEEAVVAVPFKTLNGARQFISFPADNAALDSTQSQTYQKLETAMDKYVFPPKFDFTRFDTVDPIMMYVFEFSAKLTQQDIADIWQNLPPDIAERFETQQAVVEERELIDSIISKDEDIQWMVFKVKIRAKKDFEKFRRSLITDRTQAIPSVITSPYTYNWPYDYFSLVELAKIEETATYVSSDLKQDAPISELENLEATRTATGRSASRIRRAAAQTTPTTREAQQQAPPPPRTPRVPQVEIALPEQLRAGAAEIDRKRGGGK